MKDAIDLLQKIMVALAVVLLGPLSAAARKRLPKIRAKAWRLVPNFFELAGRKPAYAPVGQDPQALLQEYWTVSGLQVLLNTVGSMHKSIGDTFKQREAALWKAMLVIYGVMSAQADSDPQVASLVAQMNAAMSNGPRAQTHVRAEIPPTPVKGKKAKETLLAAAKAKAGIPDPKAPPATGEPAAPEVHPVAVTPPAPAPAVTNGSANGSAGGPAH